MDINILVAQIKRKGYSQEQAESMALQVSTIAKNYGVNPDDLLKEVGDTFDFTDLGGFIMNNTRRQGYVTGKIKNTKPNVYVARSIFK